MKYIRFRWPGAYGTASVPTITALILQNSDPSDFRAIEFPANADPAGILERGLQRVADIFTGDVDVAFELLNDLAEGIAGAVDAVLHEAAIHPSAIKLVSMSTTLATNVLVEGQGGRVAGDDRICRSRPCS